MAQENQPGRDDVSELFKNPTVIMGILILVGFCIFALSFKSALNSISVITNNQGVTVSGVAEKIVTSDTASISLNFTVDTKVLSRDAALSKLGQAIASARSAAIKTGFTNDSIETKNMQETRECTQRDKDNYSNCTGKEYSILTQNITLTSNSVETIRHIAGGESLALHDVFNDTNPVLYSVGSGVYTYSKFDAEKTTLLAEATKNASQRADAIVQSTGNHAGAIITASQGVFQVTSKDSINTTDEGYYDTSTIDKKIRAVVRVSFKIN